MEYVYAALILHKVGKEVNEGNITHVIEAAGIKADPTRVKALVASLAEVDIDEAIKAPPAFMPAASVPTTVPLAVTETKPEEEKKKKEEKEDKEEVALEGLGSLFG